jgi:predicted ferric reductase
MSIGPRGAAAARPVTSVAASRLIDGDVAVLDQPTREGLVATVVAIGAILVMAMWWRDTTPSSVQGWGQWLTAAGRVTGLLGTYLIVIGVALMGRIAWLDRMIGMDRLALWHRRNGMYSVTLLVAHAVLIIWGYAVTGHEGVVHETTSVVLSYPDMLAATVGLLLLVLIGVLSVRALRRRIDYQTWYFIHLYTYIALALSFAHQFNSGADFANHPFNRGAWIAMYAAVGLLLLAYRIVKPLRDGRRHQIRVARVVPEGGGAVSVYLQGQRLDDLKAHAGQFFLWRFLTRDGWWQAHPFSLSAAPNGEWLRITAKGLGDHSRSLEQLESGTRVLVEGPYGAFTARRRRTEKTLLVGAGIGITPLRALFESMPSQDVALIYRAHGPDEVMFRSEIDRIAAARHARVAYLLGATADHPEYLTAAHLQTMLPDIRERDVFLCGPPAMLEDVEQALWELRVPRRQVHTEKFEL